MQYDYEFRENLDAPDVCLIAFHEEYPAAVFVRDLFIAIKAIEPNISGADITLSDYTANIIDNYLRDCCVLEKDTLDYYGVYDDFHLTVVTTIGQFELKQGATENIVYLAANNNHDCMKRINDLLLNDINFNRVN